MTISYECEYITCFPQTAHIGLLYVVIKTIYDDITPLAIDIDLSVGLTFIADRGFAASRFVFIAKKGLTFKPILYSCKNCIAPVTCFL